MHPLKAVYIPSTRLWWVAFLWFVFDCFYTVLFASKYHPYYYSSKCYSLA